MTEQDSRHAVLLIGPQIPPYGGMALQARLLENLLRGDGTPVWFFPSNPAFTGWMRPFERIPAVRTLLRAAMVWTRLWHQVQQVDVIHVFAASWLYFFAAVYPAVLFGRIRGKRVMLNYRGGEARQFFRWWGWSARPIFRMASVVSVPSGFLAKVIQDYFHVPVLIVPNILDNSRFGYKPRTVYRPKLVVTRQLEKIYDIETALKTFREIQQRHPEATLWIAGTGREEEHLRALAQSWNLKNVRFLGYVAQADLPAIYDQCDILLNTSRVDNFPGSLLEASAAGLVVVSTNAGGIPFMYQDGRNALLVEPGDWKAVAEAVERVLQSPALAQDLTRQALAVVEACDWNEVRKTLYAAYGFAPEQNEEGAVRVARLARM